MNYKSVFFATTAIYLSTFLWASVLRANDVQSIDTSNKIAFNKPCDEVKAPLKGKEASAWFQTVQFLFQGSLLIERYTECNNINYRSLFGSMESGIKMSDDENFEARRQILSLASEQTNDDLRLGTAQEYLLYTFLACHTELDCFTRAANEDRYLDVIGCKGADWIDPTDSPHTREPQFTLTPRAFQNQVFNCAYLGDSDSALLKTYILVKNQL